MSVTQRQGIITCIPKEGKDKNVVVVENLETYYINKYCIQKIASSCIARRVKTVLPQPILDDQKGFLKGRCVGENIQLLSDTLLYASKHRIPGLLLMTDFEKAFDFVEISLTAFNFGKDTKRWICTFYANIVMYVCEWSIFRVV